MRGLHVIRFKQAHEGCGGGSFLHCWPATGLQSFNQASYSGNVEAEFTRSFYGLDGGTAGGADIVNDDHASAFFLKAFHAAAHAVRFFRFTHQEAMDRRARLRADHGSSDHNGISAHSEPADSLRLPALLIDEIKEDTPSEFRAASVKRGGAAIDIVIAPDAGRESEFAQAERVGSQQLKKLFARRR